jgi:hypothetical protein
LISSAKTTVIDPAVLRKRFAELSHLMSKDNKEPAMVRFPGMDFWFRKGAQRGLAKVRECIEALDASVPEKDFFWACYSSIIRDMSRADPAVAPPVVQSIRKFPEGQKTQGKEKLIQKRRFKAQTLFRKTVVRNVGRMQELWNVLTYTKNRRTSRVVGGDARNLRYIPYVGKGQLNTSQATPLTDNSVGMVITSPPYINAQKYARSTKLELWWLGLIEGDTEALARFDEQLIGTERIPYSEYMEPKAVGNATADTILQHVFHVDRSRAGIVSRYFNDMRLALKEMRRVLRPEGYCILVVGNNVIFKRIVPNNRILAEIAQEEGFELKAMLVDEIRSRGLITKRHETAGMMTDEWIILLQKPAFPPHMSA